MRVGTISRVRKAAAAATIAAVALVVLPVSAHPASHGQNWSFTQGGIVGTFRGYHYPSEYDNPVAWTSNIQVTCEQRVRLTHSATQMAWKFSVHPHTLVVQSGPVGTTVVRSHHQSRHCWNLVLSAVQTLN